MSKTPTPPAAPDPDHVQITLLVKLNPALGTGEQRRSRLLTTARHLAAILAQGEKHEVLRADVLYGQHHALHAVTVSEPDVEQLAAQLRHNFLAGTGITEPTPWSDLITQTGEGTQRDVAGWRQLARQVLAR